MKIIYLFLTALIISLSFSSCAYHDAAQVDDEGGLKIVEVGDYVLLASGRYAKVVWVADDGKQFTIRYSPRIEGGQTVNTADLEYLKMSIIPPHFRDQYQIAAHYYKYAQ